MIHYLPTPQGARLQRSLRPIYYSNRMFGNHHIAGIEWYKGEVWLVLDYREGRCVVPFDNVQLDDMADTWVPLDERWIIRKLLMPASLK